MRVASIRTSLLLTLGLVVSSSVRADLLADFEALTPGRLGLQDGWTATSNAKVVRDSTSNGLLMQLAGSGGNAYKPLTSLSVLDGEIGTLFFRFQVDGVGVDHTLGLADVNEPSSWDDFESIVRVFPDGPDTIRTQGRNHGIYENMPLNGGANGLNPGTWYHLWMVNNNLADSVDYYIQGGSISSQRLVAQDFGFRNGTSDPLSTFLARTGGGAYSSLFVDDIHVWEGVNLTSPIGSPSSETVVIDETSGPRTPIGLNLPHLFEFAGERLQRTNYYLPTAAMPERTYGGYWNETSQWAWTSGFFAGELWKMYRQTEDSYFLNAAKSRTADLEGQEYNGGDHDIGFRVFNSFGEGYKALPDGDPDKDDYLSRILIAADTLAGRYRPQYQAIESWGSNQVIIDNMMNLELLFWASEHTGDIQTAQQWREIAINHATTTQREHVREDASTYHVVQFNGVTGEVVDKRTAQGYADESTWSRGQSWGMYGFTMSYRFTQDESFLDTAKALADYWLEQIPGDGLVPYDFDDPNPEVPLDTSAAAIASAALLELAGYVNPVDAQRYFDAAEAMLTGLSSLTALANGLDYDSILMEGSAQRANTTWVLSTATTISSRLCSDTRRYWICLATSMATALSI